MIHRSDHDKRAFFRFAFDEDWLNPHLYDLILKTDKLDIAVATEMILDAANSHEIKECGSDSLKALAKLSLLRRIEASLIEIGVRVSVTVEDDLKSVRLYGLVHSQEKKEEIEDILKKFKEIKSVTNSTIPPIGPV